ncbi:MAG: dihydropteroate synthase [Coriobacteriia bacterium]|nr:dihydropteroate synthase [Coriobacteriia bacterium]
MADLIWRCGTRILDLSRPIVMGVLNVTPDSFSDGGLYSDPISAFQRARAMLKEGAVILDIGGESTRPGAAPVDASEQIARVRPILAGLALDGAVTSVDTRSAEVAAACVEAGASIINDVAGFREPAMVDVAAGCDAGVVVMHMLGEPGSMQDEPVYDDVVAEVTRYLKGAALRLRDAGVARERIAVDPGIGFGKTLEHNLALIAGLDRIAALGYPVVVGVSRKRFIGAITGVTEPAERLGGSVAGAVCAAERGASVLRVHDVASTVQALAVASAILRERA